MRLVACLVIATVTWIPLLHLWFQRAPDVGALAARQLAVWEGDPGPHLADRRTNPEWDLMARTFTVLAFARLAREEPARHARYLAAIDQIIDRTIADVARAGVRYFLLPYGHDATHSIFVDGELALMIATRSTVAPGRARSAPTPRAVARRPSLVGPPAAARHRANPDAA